MAILPAWGTACTVDHHVSAVLRKLGLPTRRDAAAWAAGLAIRPSTAN